MAARGIVGQCVQTDQAKFVFAKEGGFRYGSLMSSVLEIEKALGQLPREKRWEIVRWLLEDLQEGVPANGENKNADVDGQKVPCLPDYSERRRRIFGNKVLPNMVLAARTEERW